MVPFNVAELGPGIMGVVNLAHGSFYMLGAYLAYSLSATLGSLTLAILVGVVLSVLFGPPRTCRSAGSPVRQCTEPPV